MHSMHLGSDMSTDVSTDVSTVFFTSQDGRASLPYGYACWHRLENGAVTFCFAERTSWVTQIFADVNINYIIY